MNSCIAADLPTSILSNPLIHKLRKEKNFDDDFTLVEDVSITNRRTLEPTRFLKPGEKDVRCDVMLQRAIEIGDPAGQAHAGCLLARPGNIPVEWRPFGLFFPGTKWRYRGSDNYYVLRLIWREARWRARLEDLGWRFGDDNRLVRCR